MNVIETQIASFLKQANAIFPQISFKLGHSGLEGTYIVEVQPWSEYMENEGYGRMEMDFVDSFEKGNEGYELLFVSEKNASRIQGEPIFEIEATPIVFDEDLFIFPAIEAPSFGKHDDQWGDSYEHYAMAA